MIKLKSIAKKILLFLLEHLDSNPLLRNTTSVENQVTFHWKGVTLTTTSKGKFMITATVDNSVFISATVTDARDNVVTNLPNPATWSIDNAALATGVASADGLGFTVTALKVGVVNVTFTSGKATGTSQITFTPGEPVAVTLIESLVPSTPTPTPTPVPNA